MKTFRFLKLAAVLWAITVVAASFLPATLAKYRSSASGDGGTAQVARWDPFTAPDPEIVIVDDTVLLVFGKGDAAARTTTVIITNNSEVTASYVLTASVDSVGRPPTPAEKAAFLEIVQDSIEANLGYDDTTGIEVPYNDFRELQITIPAATFTELRIAARVVQVN